MDDKSQKKATIHFMLSSYRQCIREVESLDKLKLISLKCQRLMKDLIAASKILRGMEMTESQSLHAQSGNFKVRV